jgi:hypothetical protein
MVLHGTSSLLPKDVQPVGPPHRTAPLCGPATPTRRRLIRVSAKLDHEAAASTLLRARRGTHTVDGDDRKQSASSISRCQSSRNGSTPAIELLDLVDDHAL